MNNTKKNETKWSDYLKVILVSVAIGFVVGGTITFNVVDAQPEILPKYVSDTNELAEKIDKLYEANEKLEKELKEYICLRKAIERFGATEEQAKCVIKTSDEVGIRPKSLGL